MKKNFFSVILLLCLVTGIYAQGRYAVGKKIMDDPSILTEPWFWIAAVVCLVLVGIYYMVKDKS